jgi:putative toxin-antitoxin system antitoxin component (TIGR02293 family)
MAATSAAKEPIACAKRIGIHASDRMELADLVQDGSPCTAFLSLTKTMNVSNQRLANLVQIRDRTLIRRCREGVLRTDESERLLRIARIYSLALQVCEGDASSARSWLSRSNRALRGESPLEAGKTEEGAREVEYLIKRLEHGVFS